MSNNQSEKSPAWQVSEKPIPYPDALAFMENRVNSILEGRAGELLWFLEHPPLYTAGTGAKAEELLRAEVFPVYQTGRGGKHTYHGPGQRIVYAMLDLRARDRDLRAHVWRLEEWIIRALDDFGAQGERRAGRIGVWVETKNGEKKIAALGVRCRRWVTSHGLSLNVCPDLSHYDGIVPCGIKGFGVTSLRDLGVAVTMEDVDGALRRHYEEIFG